MKRTTKSQTKTWINTETWIGNWSRCGNSGHVWKVWPTLSLRMKAHLVPVAVMLCGMTVVLKHFGYGAFVDALKIQLPLP